MVGSLYAKGRQSIKCGQEKRSHLKYGESVPISDVKLHHIFQPQARQPSCRRIVSTPTVDANESLCMEDPHMIPLLLQCPDIRICILTEVAHRRMPDNDPAPVRKGVRRIHPRPLPDAILDRLPGERMHQMEFLLSYGQITEGGQIHEEPKGFIPTLGVHAVDQLPKCR